MAKFLTISLCFLLVIQQIKGGPISGATCCTGCCGAHGNVPILGIVGATACLPLCLASLGTLPPTCAFCNALFLAPGP